MNLFTSGQISGPGDPGDVFEGLPKTSTTSSDTLSGLALGGIGILAGLAPARGSPETAQYSVHEIRTPLTLGALLAIIIGVFVAQPR